MMDHTFGSKDRGNVILDGIPYKVKDVTKDALDKLSAAVTQLLKDPEIVKYYSDRGSRLMTGYGPKELTAFLDQERVKTKQMIDQAGIQPE